MSYTVTPVAWSGPSFVTVIVYVITSPTATVETFTTLDNSRSMDGWYG